MPLNDSIVEDVANSDFKVVAQMGTLDALSHQRAMNLIRETAVGKTIEALHNISVAEGLGIAAAQRGDLSKSIADLGAAVSGIQQMVKGAQTTPPQTGG
jgi:hypothetical protein